MALSVPYEFAAVTLTVATELSLTNNSTTIAALTTAGVYQLFVDLSAAAAGDAFVVTIYEKALAAGTQRKAQTFVIAAPSAALANPLWVSPSLLLLRGWDFTIKQTAGTGRAVSWSLRQVA